MNTLNNVATAASLLACATLSVALFIGNQNTAPQITQTMEPIVVTAKRMQTIQLATIVVTAKRLAPTSAPSMQTVTLEPMIIVAKRGNATYL